MCDLLVDEQQPARRTKAKKSASIYQNIPTWNSQSDSGTNVGIRVSSSKKNEVYLKTHFQHSGDKNNFNLESIKFTTHLISVIGQHY